MSHVEIGSEFWKAEISVRKRINNSNLYLSGRTALTAILIDLQSQGIKTIGVPDFCCESMIEPLIRQNMEIRFYPVHYSRDGLFCTANDFMECDAVLLVNYFGFMDTVTESLLQECGQMGVRTILDQTQAVFSNMDDSMADYLFGSYRKWTGLEVGFARMRTKGRLSTWSCNIHGDAYLAKRKRARELKTAFICGNYEDEALRVRQLSSFADAEKLLDLEYISGTDEENSALLEYLDREKIKTSRQSNAKVIYEMMARLRYCKPLFSTLLDGAVPLAVPILVKEDRRDSLRGYLREHGIFCPIHWPVSDLHQKIGEEAREIYNQELSLVCDQRYSTRDMAHMMRVVTEWERTVSG